MPHSKLTPMAEQRRRQGLRLARAKALERLASTPFAEIEREIDQIVATMPHAANRAKRGSLKKRLDVLEHERGFRLRQPAHTIGRRAHDYRLKRSLSIDEITEEIGVSREAVHGLELGKPNKSWGVVELMRYCEMLKIHPSTLFYGKRVNQKEEE